MYGLYHGRPRGQPLFVPSPDKLENTVFELVIRKSCNEENNTETNEGDETVDIAQVGRIVEEDLEDSHRKENDRGVADQGRFAEDSHRKSRECIDKPETGKSNSLYIFDRTVVSACLHLLVEVRSDFEAEGPQYERVCSEDKWSTESAFFG